MNKIPKTLRPVLFAAIGAVVFASVPAWAQGLVVDGTTVESYERSIKAMADSLNEQDRKDFGQGLLNMMLTEYPAARGAQDLQLLQFMQPAVKAAHITLDGRTLEEILERGRSIADDGAPAVADAGGVGDTAEDSIEALRQCLQEKVTIDSAAIEEGAYVGHNIEVTVTNGLDWAIAGIRVAYQVFSEGRSVAWIDEDFSLSISGGIEPGETRTIGTHDDHFSKLQLLS